MIEVGRPVAGDVVGASERGRGENPDYSAHQRGVPLQKHRRLPVQSAPPPALQKGWNLVEQEDPRLLPIGCRSSGIERRSRGAARAPPLRSTPVRTRASPPRSAPVLRRFDAPLRGAPARASASPLRNAPGPARRAPRQRRATAAARERPLAVQPRSLDVVDLIQPRLRRGLDSRDAMDYPD